MRLDRMVTAATAVRKQQARAVGQVGAATVADQTVVPHREMRDLTEGTIPAVQGMGAAVRRPVRQTARTVAPVEGVVVVTVTCQPKETQVKVAPETSGAAVSGPVAAVAAVEMVMLAVLQEPAAAEARMAAAGEALCSTKRQVRAHQG